MSAGIKIARCSAAWLMCFCLLLSLFPLKAVAQRRRVIVVNAEQPNLWTLEQAHYLLAQMHRRNLDLKAKRLEDLDPNEISGLRFDVMRMLVEFGATFNQADLASNRLLSGNQTFNAGRRQELVSERDGLRRESLRLTGEIEELETAKVDVEDEDEKKRIDARIAAKTNRLARVDKQIEQLDGELGTLTEPSGALKATEGGATFDPNKLPKSVFDDAFKEAAAKQIAKFNESPQLNAALRLDNFLQMQYEIISKQLALLRDELGPGERLVFLELPQTVNAAHHESKRKWAQSWWRIAGYTRRERTNDAPVPVPVPTPSVDENLRPVTVTQDFNSILHGQPIALPLRSMTPCLPAATETFAYEGPNNSNVVRIKDKPSLPPADDPSPSSITVSVPGKVTKVTVTLNGLRHPTPDDIDLLLVGPQGQNALIMSDVGGSMLADGLNITLDDAAPAGALPDMGPLASDTYNPTNAASGDADKFPSGVPVPLGGSALSVFNGTDPDGVWSLYVVDDEGEVAGSLSGGWSLSISTACTAPPRPLQVAYRDVFVDLDEPPIPLPDGVPAPTPTPSILDGYLRTKNADLSNRMVRTVDLIPRQSSLNVNDMNLRVKSGAFNFVLSTLFGFGSSLKVQRQREQFSQFVQQELYSAAFGKGAREFGWTFTPMPGTDRLTSGVRTTYAVVVVPEEATSLVLESNGCYFPRSYFPPNDFAHTKQPEWNADNRTSRNCGGERTKAFVVPIPSARVNGGNDFWVERIDFQAVAKGKRIVVSISGKNFSPQIGVLIDGVPLVHSIGLAQPLIRDDSEAGRLTADDLKNAEVTGEIERIDSEKVLFWFKMPPDFSGTPTITLIAPGRAKDINDLRLRINDKRDTKLSEFPTKMFGNSSTPATFRIDRVRVTRSRTTPGSLTATISGAGFRKTSATPAPTSDTVERVLINGTPPISTSFESADLLTVEFPAPTDDTIKISLVSKDTNPKKVKTIESEAVANPAFLSVSDVETVSYEPATEDEPASTLVVKITGTGFTDNLTATFGGKTLDVAIRSATEAVLAIPDPKAASLVMLEDTVTKQKLKIVAMRKTKQPK